MTVILVLMMFIGFALVDHFLHHHKRAEKPAAKQIPATAPAQVAHFRHHPGHGWLLREGEHLARVGADEAAAALAGKIERIELPQAGRWVRQGQKAWSFYHSGGRLDMVSPVEGEVREINIEVLQDPSLILSDPYGRGWLMLVNVPDEQSVEHNLVPERIVDAWMAADLQLAQTRQESAAHQLLLT